jgi:hypothetical protein
VAQMARINGLYAELAKETVTPVGTTHTVPAR